MLLTDEIWVDFMLLPDNSKSESFQFLSEIGKISIGVFIDYGLVS